MGNTFAEEIEVMEKAEVMAMNNSTAVAEQRVYTFDDMDFVGNLTSSQVSYCSFDAQTQDEKAQLFNIMNNPDFRTGDKINEVIEITDVFVEVVTCTNKDTGIENVCPRVVLIDKDGVGYQSVSIGIYSAVRKLFQAYGQPTWAEPIKVKIVQITKGTNKMLTLDTVKPAKKAK